MVVDLLIGPLSRAAMDLRSDRHCTAKLSGLPSTRPKFTTTLVYALTSGIFNTATLDVHSSLALYRPTYKFAGLT
jgi:hypothetical protein